MKSLKQYILEAESSFDELNNLEATYTTESESLIIQVPDNYNEDDVLAYLNDYCMQDVPSSEENAVELFGEENSQNISDAYFEYNKLTVPEDSTLKPDLEFNKRFDVNKDNNANLTIYSLDDIKYKILFDKFIIEHSLNKEVKSVVEDIFKNTESNKLHPWAFNIKLKEITYK